MALIDLPVGSGLPAWAANGYDVVAMVVVAGAVGSMTAGVVARLVPGRGVGHRPHAIAVIIAAALFAGWAVTALLGSAAPRGEQFCLTPEYFTGKGPTTCVSRHPVWLLMTPLAVLLALAVAGLALALPSRRRWTIMGLLAFVAAVIAMAIDGQLALVEPGIFNGGGITSLRDAVVRLTVGEPVHAGLGLVVAGVLVFTMLVRRAESRRHPPPAELPTAKAPP